MSPHTPLLKILYDYIPGFNLFRGQSKFIWQASIFLTLLAGIGLDTLLNNFQKQNQLLWGVIGAAVVLLLSGLALGLGSVNGSVDWWRFLVNVMLATNESLASPALLHSEQFLQESSHHASWALIKAAATLSALACLLYLARRARWPLYGIALLATIEVFTFAYSSRASFDMTQARMPEFEHLLSSNPGDYRILNTNIPNLGMSVGVSDIWGSDPGVSLRYAEFIAHSQHENPDSASQGVRIHELNKLLSILRLRYAVMQPDAKSGFEITTLQNPLGHTALIYKYKIVKGVIIFSAPWITKILILQKR
jgi:hypothetical protein